MPREPILKVVQRRLLGLAYVGVIVGLISLSVMIYKKDFTTVVLVTLKTDHTGNSLRDSSDVKVRGLIVGTVRDVRVDSGANGGCASDQAACVTVTLALDPSQTHLIPRNVSAQILPKTVFGEQFVSLSLPQQKGPAIKAGDEISQDRSTGALEATKVLGDLLPLLQAVKPAELNATLTALATALQGRGQQLGQTLVTMDTYLKGLNPHTKTMVNDLVKLGKFSDEVNAVSPDLFGTLKNLVTSSKTIISQKAALADLLTTGADTATVLKGFLADNEQNLITVTSTSDQLYSLLQTYAPEFTCLFGGLNNLHRLASSVFHDHQMNLSDVVDQTNLGKYKPGEEPRILTGYGPSCFGLPDNPQPKINGNFQVPAKYRCFNDGAALTADACGASAQGNRSTTSYTQRALGSPSENSLIATLLSGTYHVAPDKVPPIAIMLAAPLYRGAKVSVK